jgi:hypothetical protein
MNCLAAAALTALEAEKTGATISRVSFFISFLCLRNPEMRL